MYLLLIHADVWKKPTQYCKAIILQLEKNPQHSKNWTMASRPITSWQIDGKKWKQWQIFFSWSYTLSGSPHLMEWGCTVFTLDLEPKFSLRNKKGFVVLACSFHMLELCFQPSLLHGAPSAAESTASLRPDPGVPPLVTFSLSSRQGDLAPFYLFLWFHYILKLFFK